MKIAFCYAPFEESKGTPLLSQNRQFQWYGSAFGSYAVYPVVMAGACTLMSNKGHDVVWMDYIAERKTFRDFTRDFLREKPDLAIFECKTPVIKRIWEIVEVLKKKSPRTKFVLCGDHVSAMPKESIKNSRADFVLVGGDFDILLYELVRRLQNSKLGVQDNSKIVKTEVPVNLDRLPIVDRELTKWELYSKNNGNFKYTPGAYTMAGRDCWWRRKGGCTFCSWTGLYPKWRVASPEKLLDEIDYLISLGVKEVFDDTGTFPVGSWLTSFCTGMIERGYNKKVRFGCNMRAGILTPKAYKLMRKAGFRFILYGLESANDETLSKINKGEKVSDILKDLRMAKKAGLSPHVTIMFGYPFESINDAKRTVELSRKLFRNNVIESLQATIVIPYPGTKLFEDCKNGGLLKTEDWDQYDMRMPIMKCPISDEKLKELVRECYSTVITPKFLIRKVVGIRNLSDLKFLCISALKFFGKRGDFK